MLRHKRAKNNLEKLIQCNASAEKFYHYALCLIKAAIYLCINWIQRALTLNRNICSILAHINRAMNIFHGGRHMDCSKQANVRMLYLVNVLKEKISNNILPEVLKQRSKEWFDLRKQFKVTGSTCYNALGMSKLKEKTDHYKEFVLKNFTPTYSDQVKKYMAHGSKNEINAVATVTGVLMPALLPVCTHFFEDGTNFLDGDNCRKWVEISSDEMLRTLNHNTSEDCANKLSYDHDDIVLEIKCPYPNKDIVN